VRLGGSIQVEGQLEEQRGQRERRHHRTPDLIRRASTERPTESREDDSGHQQRFSCPQSATQSGARTGELCVCPVAIDDVTKGHPEMVEQGQFEHVLPLYLAREMLDSILLPIDRKNQPEIVSPAMAKHSSHILELARKGAEHRHQELKAEIAALVKHFPHLAGSRGGRRPQAQPSAGQSSAAESPTAAAEVPEPRTRKRRKMSAAARKKISDAQKARWAKQKGKG
jgi:hypothetical protein